VEWVADKVGAGAEVHSQLALVVHKVFQVLGLSVVHIQEVVPLGISFLHMHNLSVCNLA